jgi:hypothetical protein
VLVKLLMVKSMLTGEAPAGAAINTRPLAAAKMT